FSWCVFGAVSSPFCRPVASQVAKARAPAARRIVNLLILPSSGSGPCRGRRAPAAASERRPRMGPRRPPNGMRVGGCANKEAAAASSARLAGRGQLAGGQPTADRQALALPMGLAGAQQLEEREQFLVLDDGVCALGRLTGFAQVLLQLVGR